jgi:1-phosphofructokinase
MLWAVSADRETGKEARRAERTSWGSPEAEAAEGPDLVVVAPSLLLTVDLETAPDGEDEIHIHPGGQGYWVSQMAAAMGARVRLCAVVGGEPGKVIVGLIEAEAVAFEPVVSDSTSSARIGDGRHGDSQAIAASPVPPLGRHEVDELFGLALASGIDADAVLLTGPRHEQELDPEFFTRLAGDLRDNGTFVAADLSGNALRAALESGLDFVKVADDELAAAGFATGIERGALVTGLDALEAAGGSAMLVSRGDDPALARAEGNTLEIRHPDLTPRQTRGTGDSTFAAVVAVKASGASWDDALRIGVGAGSLNVTRRGLGTGHRADVASLAEHVEITKL